MPDLAFIHPLLVTNPLPTERLAGAVEGTASAAMQAQRSFAAFLELPELATAVPALAFNEQHVHGHASMWLNTLQPTLGSVHAALSLYAAQLVQDLAPLVAAAPFAATEPDARKIVFDGLQLLKMAAVAQQLVAREAALAADNFRSRFARAMVAYVIEIDNLADAHGNEHGNANPCWEQAKQRQDALGKAMSMVAAAVSSLGAMESAWRGQVAHVDILLDQLRDSSLNSALLLGRLQLAGGDWRALAARLGNGDSARLRAARLPTGAEARGAELRTVSAFRNGAISDGAEAVAGVIGVLDSLSVGIAQLPQPDANTTLQVGEHIGAVRRLAHAWPRRGRPSLLGSMANLKQFGDDFVAHDAPRLQAAFQRMAAGDSAGQQGAAILIAGIIERLAGLVAAFESVRRDLGAYLQEVAGASADLETDTARVTRHLQVGQARAQALAGRVSQLQDKLDGAHERQRWHWLLGPLGALLTNEIDVLGGKMAAVASQLTVIRAEQAASISDAAYLQQLLPALSSYLTGVDRVGAGIGAALSGTRTLQIQLAELRGAIVARPATGAGAAAQLQAALADWRDITRRLGHLPSTIG
jgi:hypothetical protein